MKTTTKISRSVKENARVFLALRSPASLIHLLNADPQKFNYHLNHPLYYSFNIPKKKGGVRKIQAPNEELKELQQRVSYFLQAIYFNVIPDCVHGFVKKLGNETARNIVSNAKVHVKSASVLNIDIEDFFPSISAKTVYETLINEPVYLDPEIAKIIALLCTYEKRLPTGAPSSPVLSNIVCLRLDQELMRFSVENKLRYTRYVDDLTFSSDGFISNETIDAIQLILQQHQFKVNKKKLRVTSKYRKQTVTGLVVNEKVNVDRKYIRKIRAILHDVQHSGLEYAAQKYFSRTELLSDELNAFSRQLAGSISFIGDALGKGNPKYLRLHSLSNSKQFR